MSSAPIPNNEQDRIEALESYNILDTLPEKEYNDIVKLASIICNTPIALVSLVDRNRQWFKAKVGLDAHETSREVSFCAHAILEPDQLFMVEDATKDKRFVDNNLVTKKPEIRFYAGFPLRTSSGHTLGTLCVIDNKPKKITPEQTEALRTLAKSVVSLLELRKSLSDSEKLIEMLKESNEQLDNFAHICSHDLQQPLRTVRSFTELLANEYQDKFDEEAEEYIYYTNPPHLPAPTGKKSQYVHAKTVKCMPQK